MKIHILRMLVTMSLFWILLSGYFKINLLILGVLSVIVVVVFAYRMNVLQHKGQSLFFPFLPIIAYWAWLFGEIIKSNISVAKLIINPKLPIKPLLKVVHADQDTEIGRVLYANSITLTPGTVSINVSKDRGIIVHALHEDSIAELDGGEMHDHIMALETHVHLNNTDQATTDQTTTDNSGDKS